jgi:methylaspartate ammonia-lyase
MKAQIVRILTAPAVVPIMATGQEPTEVLSVGLLLEDGRVAWGDCVGAEPVLGYEEAREAVRRVVAPALEGRELSGFRDLAAEVEALSETVGVTQPRRATDGESGCPGEANGREGISRRTLLTAPARLFQAAADQPAASVGEKPPVGQITMDRPLQPALRYGLSQALLRAAGLIQGRTMAQVLAGEWGLDPPRAPVPILARSAYNRRDEAEEMIRYRVASLPQASIDDVAAQVGAEGGRLTQYIRWLRERIAALGGEEYRPTIHLDLTGALGEIADHHPGHMLGHLYAWRLAAEPYPLRVEDPILLQDRQAQIDALGRLRENLRLRRIDVQLVARRWIHTTDDLAAFLAIQPTEGRPPTRSEPGTGLPAHMIHLQMPQLGSLHNAVDAVLACRRAGVRVLLGGSGAVTDLATRVAVHVALATRPELFLTGPGTAVGWAISLTRNEMSRTLAAFAPHLPMEDRLDGVEI